MQEEHTSEDPTPPLVNKNVKVFKRKQLPPTKQKNNNTTQSSNNEQPKQVSLQNIGSKMQQQLKKIDEQRLKAIHQLKNMRILRVNQLDAERLDLEIKYGLQWYFSRIFTFLKPQFLEKIQPELNLVLQLLIYQSSIYDQSQSFGDKLQNLKYRNEWRSNLKFDAPVAKYQKVFHALLSIGLPYFFVRFTRFCSDQNWNEADPSTLKRKIWNIVKRVEFYYQIIYCCNFLTFLYQGKYRSLSDRFLGMRLVYDKPFMIRNVSFDYMNRELIWNGLAELLLFIIPLIPWDKYYQTFSNLFNTSTSVLNATTSTTIPTQITHISNCPICNMDPIQIPYISQPCKHQFCYSCIVNYCKEENVSCPVCNTVIQKVKRLEYSDLLL